MAEQGEARGLVVAGLRARHDRLERLVGKPVAPGEASPAGRDFAAADGSDLPLLMSQAPLHANGLNRAGVEGSVDSRP
jgi:hypothetical protein